MQWKHHAYGVDNYFAFSFSSLRCVLGGLAKRSLVRSFVHAYIAVVFVQWKC